MNKFGKLKKNISINYNYGLHIKIIYFFKVIKNIFKSYNISVRIINNINVTIIRGLQIDDIKRNNINMSNNLLNKFCKIQNLIEKDIENISLNYLLDKKITNF